MKRPPFAGRRKPGCAGASQLLLSPVAGSKRWILRCLISVNHSAASRLTQTGPSPSVASSGQMQTGSAMSAPACVHEKIVAGYQPSIVGSQEQHHGRNIG